jgi:hypothetical protein
MGSKAIHGAPINTRAELAPIISYPQESALIVCKIEIGLVSSHSRVGVADPRLILIPNTGISPRGEACAKGKRNPLALMSNICAGEEPRGF